MQQRLLNHTRENLVASGNGVQGGARVRALRLEPVGRFAFMPVLEPAIRIGNGCAEVKRRSRLAARRRAGERTDCAAGVDTHYNQRSK